MTIVNDLWHIQVTRVMWHHWWEFCRPVVLSPPGNAVSSQRQVNLLPGRPVFVQKRMKTSRSVPEQLYILHDFLRTFKIFKAPKSLTLARLQALNQFGCSAHNSHAPGPHLVRLLHTWPAEQAGCEAVGPIDAWPLLQPSFQAPDGLEESSWKNTYICIYIYIQYTVNPCYHHHSIDLHVFTFRWHSTLYINSHSGKL